MKSRVTHNLPCPHLSALGVEVIAISKHCPLYHITLTIYVHKINGIQNKIFNTTTSNQIENRPAAMFRNNFE